MDRLVGAPSPSESGLFYQWGSLDGHKISDGYVFNSDSYSAAGLSTIHASLNINQDAARAYYGNTACMPSYDQVSELAQYCTISELSSGIIRIKSNVNGNSIVLKADGSINGTELNPASYLNVWSLAYRNSETAYSIHTVASEMRIARGADNRYLGLAIWAVHS